MILVYTIFPNKKSAEMAIEKILKNRLAACINYWPIETQYLWTKTPTSKGVGAPTIGVGEIQKAKEWALIIKTIKKNYQKIEQLIKKNNPYETPAILSWPVAKVEKNYLKWLDQEIK